MLAEKARNRRAAALGTVRSMAAAGTPVGKATIAPGGGEVKRQASGLCFRGQSERDARMKIQAQIEEIVTGIYRGVKLCRERGLVVFGPGKMELEMVQEDGSRATFSLITDDPSQRNKPEVEP